MNLLLDFFYRSKELKPIYDSLEKGVKEQNLIGLTGSSKALFIKSVYLQQKKPMLIVGHNLYQAQKLYEDLLGLLSEEEVWLYPVNDLLVSEIGVSSPELRAQRIEVLNRLVSKENGIYITTIAALRRFMPRVQQWKEMQLSYQLGEDIDSNEFSVKLVQMGYERREMIDAPGQFSIRGGIIDVFPLTEENPLRIELFDTEVDSIRSFSLDDQRSREMRKSVEIGPATEYIFSDEQWEQGIVLLEKKLQASLEKISNEHIQKELSEKVGYDIARLKNKERIEQIFKYSSLFYDVDVNLLSYFQNDALVVFDEMVRIHETSEHLDKEEAEWITNMLEGGVFVHDVALSHSFNSIVSSCPRKLYMNLFHRSVAGTHPTVSASTTCKSMQEFFGQMNVIKTEDHRWKKGKYTVFYVVNSDEKMQKLEVILRDYEVDVDVALSYEQVKPGKSYIVKGPLSSGFELPLEKVAVVTEKELFSKKAKKPQKRQKMSNAERIKNYQELKVGDYVVHVNHGIGKFLGIETLEIGGIHKDYLHIIYQGDDKLYVPVDQIDQIQKYVASEGKEPKVYKLGGSEWKKVKSKVERSVQDIADDLLKLYAEREASRGFAFSKDSIMQQEFESAFPYKETDDQLRSIDEIKVDMENVKPMDRLLCGDVGYGKTEVAIRAAFKAIADGKQVAFLVPTTILAQQHYNTIRERFQDFPIEVGMLSRFRKPKEIKETVAGLKNGTVDIVIGTHRLLSKDIVYKDLGLLIIDEEQRFGVTHKEKIKQLKANIDVLTLTATPIPRTLHMSMLGVRDLSVIETPPENRFPVQTYVLEESPMLVKEAIEREMAREGQVFYLYNRVEDIERKAQEIQALVPEARVIFAHGRMKDSELESIILSFLEGQYDVLVSTTIIETGVDIPNVNTLIVCNSDRMGLSQLYQLRGRVGRSNRVAYAYFTYQREKILNEVAEKRLQAIKEFTELGSGFKIAMRDLSIRGAGNILGAQQHGFIDSVGFDLYSQMLKEAVERKRGIPQEEKGSELEIDITVDAYIPDQYISDSKQKIEMYKRFRDVTEEVELQELQDEMNDRFGEYPEEVAYLFQVTLVKVLAMKAGIEKIKQIKHEIKMYMTLEVTANIEGSILAKNTANFGRAVRLGYEDSRITITIDKKTMNMRDCLALAENLLRIVPQSKKLQEV